MPYAQQKSDIYGHISLEIKSRRPPADQPPTSHVEAPSLWHVLQRCWDLDPTARPSARQLLADSEILLDITHNMRAASSPRVTVGVNETPSHDSESSPDESDLSGKVEFQNDMPIFTGAYSSVYRGILREGGQMVCISEAYNPFNHSHRQVAIKVLRITDGAMLSTMRRVSHTRLTKCTLNSLNAEVQARVANRECPEPSKRSPFVRVYSRRFLSAVRSLYITGMF